MTYAQFEACIQHDYTLQIILKTCDIFTSHKSIGSLLYIHKNRRWSQKHSHLVCQWPRALHCVQARLQISDLNGLFNFDIGTIFASVQDLDLEHVVDLVV